VLAVAVSPDMVQALLSRFRKIQARPKDLWALPGQPQRVVSWRVPGCTPPLLNVCGEVNQGAHTVPPAGTPEALASSRRVRLAGAFQ
jgi:hypothetical protein